MPFSSCFLHTLCRRMLALSPATLGAGSPYRLIRIRDGSFSKHRIWTIAATPSLGTRAAPHTTSAAHSREASDLGRAKPWCGGARVGIFGVQVVQPVGVPDERREGGESIYQVLSSLAGNIWPAKPRNVCAGTPCGRCCSRLNGDVRPRWWLRMDVRDQTHQLGNQYQNCNNM